MDPWNTPWKVMEQLFAKRAMPHIPHNFYKIFQRSLLGHKNIRDIRY